MSHLRTINNKTCRRLRIDEQLRHGDIFGFKNRPELRRDWTRVHRINYGRDPGDTPRRYPKFVFYREIDPLIYAMKQVKRKARK